jgi:hypothetical protein
MPLFLCPICGWTTTASAAQAVRAHHLGVPDCSGVLEELAYAGTRVAGPLAVGTRGRGKASREEASRREASRGPAPSKTPDP